MATGTGKTLTAAAVIKLFLRTGNARRVLFLVDRLELEDQANKAFAAVLSKNDYKTVIYKENRDDWRAPRSSSPPCNRCCSTTNTSACSRRPTFDLVISDEAHRSIGGNARAVFDYFIGYKLGLTATPRDYLKQFDKFAKPPPATRASRAPPAARHLPHLRLRERPADLPLFAARWREGRLPDQPTVVDARTEVTTNCCPTRASSP
jgi:type I restriction enzyme R subunit